MNIDEFLATESNKWLGRTQTVHDDITAFPITALTGTLDREEPPAQRGTPVPPLWHWLYFLPVYRPGQLRQDGHGQGGEFMPPIPLPRRVWAGSKFIWNPDNPLRAGDRATRISRIESITGKDGSSGKLVFVKVVHEFHNESGLTLTNEHLSAFREAAKPGKAKSEPARAEKDAPWHRELVPDPVLLFRYSALMFNSHRIHYDHPYAIDIEAYPAILVQGPLISTLLADLLRRKMPDAGLRTFELKALRPSFVGRTMHLRGSPSGSNIRLWASDDEGYVTMTATAQIDS